MGPRLQAPACVLAIALAALAITGCGDGGEGQPASTPARNAPAQGEPKPYRGGEKSIEEFGSEAKGAEQEAIVGSFKSYLGALSAGDFAKACFYLASQVHESLEELAKRGMGQQGCAAILPKILSSTAPAVSRAQAEGEITKVRVEGARAFVVFHAPGAKLYQMTMARENDRWKTAVVAAAVLVPDL